MKKEEKQMIAMIDAFCSVQPGECSKCPADKYCNVEIWDYIENAWGDKNE